jgi:hypothetical protein
MTDQQPRSDQRLGAFQKTFVARERPGRVILGVAIFCVLFAVIEFITAINKSLSPPSEILSDRYRQDAIMIALVLGIVFFLLALILGALYYSHIKHRVDVYENGLVVVTWRAKTMFLWDEIAKLTGVPIVGRSNQVVNWNFTVTDGEGQQAQFRGLEGLMTLKKIIERKARYLL